jgi:hypothetical protein
MAKLPANAAGRASRMPGRTALRSAGAPNARVDNRPPETIPPEHREAVQEGVDQADRGEFATDAEMKAVFRRFGP